MSGLGYGNITFPVVNIFTKADAAVDGGFSIFVWIIIFAMILMAYYKKYNNFEKGMAVAGFVTGSLCLGWTVYAQLPWNFLWMSIVFMILGFIGKAVEE